MILAAFRRLVGLAIAFALISTMVQHLGPGLAARSMGGFVDSWDAAEAGNITRSDAIGSDLARQWQDLSGQVTVLVNRAEAALQGLAP